MKHEILFVDDEPAILEGIKRNLRHSPFVIHTKTSAEEALGFLENHQVDVVVSDEKMPGMGGAEFLTLVRKLLPSTIRIILTGEASVDAAVLAINEGRVYRYLRKPVHPSELSHTITYGLLERSLEEKSAALLKRAQKHRHLLEALDASHPGLVTQAMDDDTVISSSAAMRLPELVESIDEELNADSNREGNDNATANAS